MLEDVLQPLVEVRRRFMEAEIENSLLEYLTPILEDGWALTDESPHTWGLIGPDEIDIWIKLDTESCVLRFSIGWCAYNHDASLEGVEKPSNHSIDVTTTDLILLLKIIVDLYPGHGIGDAAGHASNLLRRHHLRKKDLHEQE